MWYVFCCCFLCSVKCFWVGLLFRIGSFIGLVRVIWVCWWLRVWSGVWIVVCVCVCLCCVCVFFLFCMEGMVFGVILILMFLVVMVCRCRVSCCGICSVRFCVLLVLMLCVSFFWSFSCGCSWLIFVRLGWGWSWWRVILNSICWRLIFEVFFLVGNGKKKYFGFVFFYSFLN